MPRSDIEWLMPFAKGLEYPKIDRLRTFNNRKRLERPLNLIESSIRDASAIFFFPGMFAEISMFGSSIHVFGLRNKNDILNYITYAPQLDEKFLRRAFTGIEYLLYKLCHIILEYHKTDYHFETQKASARLNRLKEKLPISNWIRFRNIFDEIFSARNAFAHSFIDIEDIYFRGEKLEDCFGITHTGGVYIDHDSEGIKIFTDELNELTTPLVNLFVENQFSQIDKQKFFRLCDTILKEKSLGR